MKKPIYLDYNSTTPLFPSVKSAMVEAMDLVGNAASIHQMGQKVRASLEKARHHLATFLDTSAENIIFTSCATEAFNMILREGQWDKIILSAVEHVAAHRAAEATDAQVVHILASKEGVLDLAQLEAELKKSAEAKEKVVVSVMQVNNVFGTIYPVAKISALCHQYGAVFCCDVVQSAGRIPVSLNQINADYYFVSAHKFGGPKGVGALVRRPGLDPRPLVIGGGQEKSFRGGTENVIGIVGMGAAAIEAGERLHQFEALEAIRDEMESVILSKVPGALILGKGHSRVSNTTCLFMPGVESAKQVIAFDLEGICVSSGSACSSGKVKKFDFLESMGFDETMTNSILRISMGWDTTREEALFAAETWCRLASQLGH